MAFKHGCLVPIIYFSRIDEFIISKELIQFVSQIGIQACTAATMLICNTNILIQIMFVRAKMYFIEIEIKLGFSHPAKIV